jgi:hypothetical protein
VGPLVDGQNSPEGEHTAVESSRGSTLSQESELRRRERCYGVPFLELNMHDDGGSSGGGDSGGSGVVAP